MQSDRKKNICDYVVSSSDSAEDSDSDIDKLKTSKIRSDEDKSTTDSTEIRDELLDSLDNIHTKKGSTGRNDHSEKEISAHKPVRDRTRSRSRSRDRNRKDYKRRSDHSDDKRRPYNRHDDYDKGRNRSDNSRRYDNRGRRRDFDRRTDGRRNDDRGRRPHEEMDLARINREAYANNADRNLQQTCAKLKQQVEKRKLLWQGNKEKKIANHWEAMLSTCTDDKQAEKLKKLIGLKDSQLATVNDEQAGGSSSTADGAAVPSQAEQMRIKQEEIFRSLDQQYEVARVSTHTHRGMGLGFTSKMNEYMAHMNAHSAAAATLDDP